VPADIPFLQHHLPVFIRGRLQHVGKALRLSRIEVDVAGDVMEEEGVHWLLVISYRLLVIRVDTPGLLNDSM
jgi:hypothetical protein